MKKLLSLIFLILFIALTVAGCGSANENAQNPQSSEQDIREIVWNTLTNESKEEIVGSWEDAELEKVIVNKRFVFLNDAKYDGMELYHVVFKTKRDALLGPIGAYVDPQTKEIVGGDYRE